MPPPLPVVPPLRIVTPLMLHCDPRVNMSRLSLLGRTPLLPSMMVVDAPPPMMVRSSVMVSSVDNGQDVSVWRRKRRQNNLVGPRQGVGLLDSCPQRANIVWRKSITNAVAGIRVGNVNVGVHCKHRRLRNGPVTNQKTRRLDTLESSDIVLCPLTFSLFIPSAVAENRRAQKNCRRSILLSGAAVKQSREGL